MKLDAEKYRHLARMLIHTRPVELSCEEWVGRVGAYAERVLADLPLCSELECVRQHIDLCPECAEEFQAILEAIREG
ncbi:MAG: hypothetical protein SFX72_18450 [Isosphaeraceae bacterium]|nr:hypothetical protein [Isosphaeraceae bacterium]